MPAGSIAAVLGSPATRQRFGRRPSRPGAPNPFGDLTGRFGSPLGCRGAACLGDGGPLRGHGARGELDGEHENRGVKRYSCHPHLIYPASSVHRLIESLAAAIDSVYHRPRDLPIQDAIHNLHRAVFDEAASVGLSESDRQDFQRLADRFVQQWALLENSRSSE